MLMEKKKANKKQKGSMKIQPKGAAEDKGVIEEYLYMIPEEVTVRELEQAVTCVSEKAKEIWIELDMMEVMLATDSLIFENMLDTFDTPQDQTFLEKKGIKAVYAINYNSKDKEAVKAVLSDIYQVFGGFVASDTEDLEPFFDVAEF